MTATRTVLRDRRVRLLATALGLLVLAWLAAPHWSTPPLYDGVALPDEPYRYVSAPPHAAKTPPPGSATGHATVVNGRSQVTYIGSGEQGPQVQLVIDKNAAALPPDATVTDVRAQPLAPTTQPTDATIWGNVYRLTATSDKGPVQIHGTIADTEIILRAPTGPTPQAVMEYNDGTGWHRLPSARIGNDIYSAPIPAIGDYALATLPGQPQPVPATTAGNGGGGGLDGWILIPGIALLVLIAVIAAIRWSHSIAHGPAPAGGDTDAFLTFARLVAVSAPRMNLPAEQHTALRTQADRLREAAEATAPDRGAPARVRRRAPRNPPRGETHP